MRSSAARTSGARRRRSVRSSSHSVGRRLAAQASSAATVDVVDGDAIAVRRRPATRRYSRRKWSMHEAGDVRAPFVVIAAPRTCALDDAARVAPAHPEPVAVDRDDDVARHRTLAVADRGRDHLAPSGASPLIAATSGGVGGPGPHARLQRRGGGQHDLVLAERREHFVDVAEEDRARARRAARPASRAACGTCRAGTRRGAARPRSCRCRGHRRRRGCPVSGARIASSCSAWMVATMSRIRPVRSRSSAASSAPSPTTVRPDVSAVSASKTSSSRPMRRRPWVWKWRRRATPIGSTAVAR